MPVTYRLDVSADVVVSTAQGVVTDDEVLEYANSMVNDPAIDPGVDQLIDLRNVEAVAVMGATVRRIAEIFRRFDPAPVRAKLAIVASKDMLFGMARMYEIYRDRDSIGLFREVEEATQWLGLPGHPTSSSNGV